MKSQTTRMDTDTRSLFRNLVAGKYVYDFNYAQESSFKTVFHISLYEYCCCPCSFEYEFIDFLSADGVIDEEMYDRVVENILNGECPHVASAPPEFVTETSVYGIHIASVVGPVRVVKTYSYDYLNKRGKIFRLEPCKIAVLKYKGDFVDTFYRARVLGCCSWCIADSLDRMYAVCAKRMGHSNKVRFWNMAMVWYSIQHGNFGITTKTVLNSRTGHNAHDIARVLALSFSNALLENWVQKWVLKCCKTGIKEVLEKCAEVAVLYNKPEFLTRIIKLMSQSVPVEDIKQTFTEIFSLLHRKTCKTIVEINGYTIDIEKLSKNKLRALRVKLLVSLLDTYHGILSDEISASLREILDSQNENVAPDNAQKSLIGAYIRSLPGKYINCFKDDGIQYRDKLNTFLTFGSDIDHIEDGLTPLTRFLNERTSTYIPRYRELLEVLIYENSSLQLNVNAVETAITHETFVHWNSKTFRFPGTFLLDSRVHSRHGHDHATEYALNFTVPLLIECGYPVTKAVIVKCLEISSLHTPERAYCEQTLENPRSLLKQSRDTLRKHFKGRRIHRFVETVNIPKHIKDIIMLKHILINARLGEDDDTY